MNLDTPLPILYLFAKAPLPGEVKTRMQPMLSPDACANLAAIMCRQICATLHQHWHGMTVIKAAPDSNHPLFKSLSQRYGFELEAQIGSDLGERMNEALSDGIGRGGSAAVIGADVPHIPAAIVREACHSMNQGRSVVGPASDGGFYFLGLHQPAPDLFRGIRWGEEDVLQDLLDRADAASIGISFLPELRDIDRYEDLLWLADQEREYSEFVDVAKAVVHND